MYSDIVVCSQYQVSTGAITLSGLCLEGAQWSQELGLVATTGKQCCKLDLLCCPVQVYKCVKLTLLCANEHNSCNCHLSNVQDWLFIIEWPFSHIYIYVQIGSEPTEQEYPSYYECPLYLTPARRHFITSFSLPTNVQPDHWTMQKVALFTVIWSLELFTVHNFAYCILDHILT